MTTPYVTTLDPDPRDTDRHITLSPAEYADEIADWWRTASHTERVRWWLDATDDEHDLLRDALGAADGWAAINAVVAAGLGIASTPRRMTA